VCLNLLTNAVQAMSPGGGVLRVRSYLAEGSVRLEVTDTGPGICAEARAHIFEPFFTTKKEGEGTGLGLSVSYGIVTAHGGTIEVVETGVGGTTFRVALPAGPSPASAQETTREAPFALRSPLAGIKLLFVDDEPALRSGMEAFGALRGFTVITAADGLEALETARSTSVDAIVCDLRMPGMDGYAFHEKLREEWPGLAARTVFITGDVMTTAVARGSASRQPVITKPFAFDRIEEALIAVMRGTPYVPSARGAG
jgi:CheY-like chemotaxis protein